MPLLFVLSAAAFVSAFTIQMINPLVPAIARDFSVPVETAAMLATGYTFTYAFSQLLLGPIGDAVGKARVIKACLALLTASMLVSAVAARFEYLFAARMLSGIGGGGIIPVAFAIIGDRYPIAERQVALSRLVMASQFAILFGSGAGGLIAATAGWRHMFIWPSILAAAVCVLAFVGLPARSNAQREPMSFARSKAGYVEAASGPFARIALGGVFMGGLAMFGLMPFIAARLEQRGLGGLRESGIVLAGMSIGGIAFTLAVKRLLQVLGRGKLVRTGGVLVALGLTGVAYSPNWQTEALCFMSVGCGYFMVHNSLQALATELAPNARGSGVALFAFTLFLGQAFGPLVYRALFASLGPSKPIALGALALFTVAMIVAAKLDAVDHPRTA